jgi:primosomal replication protein N
VNQLVLSALIVEAAALRYTPAGVPALDLRLEHESEASEAGQQRAVKVAIRAVALGGVAETLVRQAIGSGWTFTGF